MKLRLRLALTLLGMGLPLLALLFLARAHLERRTAVDNLERIALARMLGGGREECERRPELWPDGLLGARLPGPPRGPRREPLPPRRNRPPGAPTLDFFAYRADFTSANPDAPALTPELVEAIRDGGRVAWRGELRSGEGLSMLVRMPWSEEPDSPCALVWAHQQASGAPSLTREFLLGALAVLCLLAGGMLLAAGPIVARVRRLTVAVRRAASERYAAPVPVEGRDELSELAQAFNAAGGELRAHTDTLARRERSLREFVEGTTHDLMLPLTVLQGHLVALRERASGEPAELASDALEEAHYMASLVGNLATAAKLEADEAPLRRDAVDLVLLIERVVARHARIAREKAVTLEPVLPGDPVVVLGDGTLLEQALSNLVHNAVRYVERGGRVVIVLSTSRGAFSLRVLDDGPGLPAEQLERLTERRWRADAARSRHPDGSGLGLAIANEVALRHGFRLGLRRAPELGGLEVEIAGALGEGGPRTVGRDGV